MNRPYRATNWMLGILLLAGGPAWAAESTEWAPQTPPPSQAANTWGPYTSEGVALSERNSERFGWPIGVLTLQPYAQLMAVYEDNLFLNSIDKKSEFYAVATPGAMLVYGRPQGVYLYLDFSMDFTTLQESNNSVHDGQTVSLAGKWGDAKSQLSASHAFRDVRDIDVQVGTRLKRRTNTTSVDYEYRVSSKTSLGLLGRHVLNQFSESSYSDYRDYSLSGRLSWQALPKTTLYGRAGHGWVDVDDRADANSDAQYDEVAVGLSGRPGARLETSGEVGVQHRYFEDSGIDDVTREVGSIRVTGDFVERLRTWVTALASMEPAINAPGYTVFGTRIEPGISRRLFSERIVGGLSGMWGQNEYSGAAEGVSDPRVYDGRKDQYWGINVNIDCWIGRYWSAGAGYSYMKNDSDADETLVQGRGTDASSYEAGRWMLRVAFNR